MHAVAVTLEKQPVSRPNAQNSANLDGHSNLAFTRDFGLLLHGDFQFLTLAHFPYFDMVSIVRQATLRLSLRAGFVKKLGKRRTPGYFGRRAKDQPALYFPRDVAQPAFLGCI